MANQVKPIPDGYHSVTPYLMVKGCAAAIEFYKKAFGAAEIGRFPWGEDKIGHAEIQIGDSRIMLADEFPEMGYRAPEPGGNNPVMIHLYVEDVDRVFQQAVEAGANVERAVQDQFYGDRSGYLIDPYGHRWNIATRKENLSLEEMRKRAAAAHS